MQGPEEKRTDEDAEPKKETEIEVRDLDVDEEQGDNVTGGLTKDPDWGGEIRKR